MAGDNAVVTTDPATATIFFVPVFPTRELHRRLLMNLPDGNRCASFPLVACRKLFFLIGDCWQELLVRPLGSRGHVGAEGTCNGKDSSLLESVRWL